MQVMHERERHRSESILLACKRLHAEEGFIVGVGVQPKDLYTVELPHVDEVFPVVWWRVLYHVHVCTYLL